MTAFHPKRYFIVEQYGKKIMNNEQLRIREQAVFMYFKVLDRDIFTEILTETAQHVRISRPQAEI
jgi:hypothetical protein